MTISKAHLATGRAVDQLRRQLGIIFQEDNGESFGACPIEGLTGDLFSALAGNRQLLITAARARSLGLKIKDQQAVRIDAESLSLAELLSLADPLAEKQALPELALSPATPSEEMLLVLARYASLLPSFMLTRDGNFPDDWLHVNEADIREYWAAPALDMVPLAEAKLPIEGAEDAKIICFRQRYGTSVHLALLIGEISDNPLTRIHSSCITGDILGSLRCDCSDQLKLALHGIKKEGAGILLYLHQEGRGIGITNKLRAYRLQEQGIDTYDANLMLGYGEDERDFAIAAAMLKKLNVSRMRMLSNNPHKIAALEKAGITITGRVPLVAPSGKHNQSYLETKEKAGHLFKSKDH